MALLRSRLYSISLLWSLFLGSLVLFGAMPSQSQELAKQKDSAAQSLPDESQCQQIQLVSGTPKTILGWCLSISRNKGNCLACHAMNTQALGRSRANPWPESLPDSGNIALPLSNMKNAYPNKSQLAAAIFDLEAFSQTSANRPLPHHPVNIMPPFGKHMILSQREIALIVDFLHTL